MPSCVALGCHRAARRPGQRQHGDRWIRSPKIPEAVGATSIQSADVRGTRKAGVDGTKAALALLIEAWERTTLTLNLVLAVGALRPHLIQDTASELPRGTTRSTRWSFIRSPQPALNHPVRGGRLAGPTDPAVTMGLFKRERTQASEQSRSRQPEKGNRPSAVTCRRRD